MVHQYKMGGYNIVIDVNSGAIHLVDDLTYDMIAMYESSDKETIFSALAEKYPDKAQDVPEAWQEIQDLIASEDLFSKDNYEPYITDFANRPTVVKALCLHIAHDCNLACKYCFAEEGEYHGKRELMSFEVGKKALDFLVARQASQLGSGFLWRRTAFELPGC